MSILACDRECSRACSRVFPCMHLSICLRAFPRTPVSFLGHVCERCRACSRACSRAFLSLLVSIFAFAREHADLRSRGFSSVPSLPGKFAILRAFVNILLHARSHSRGGFFFHAVTNIVKRVAHSPASVISARMKAFPRMPASIFAHVQAFLVSAEMFRARS